MRGRYIRLITASAVFALGALGGVLLERYVGTDSFLDWSGLRYAMTVRSRSADRVEAPAQALSGKRTMVALAFGQSNAGNSGETPGRGHAAVFEFEDGRLYRARDPLLGAGGKGGSIWLRLGTKAVESGEFDAVVLVNLALGTTGVTSWAPGGGMHGKLLAKVAEARANGLTFTHLLWQQGEADAQSGTSADAYRERFLAMVSALRNNGVDAPIYVALASRCGKTRESAPVREAQAALKDVSARILPGPDTDALGFAERYDGCHFSTEGLDKAAALWWEAIRQNR